MDIAKLAGISPGTWSLKKINPNDERETYMLTNGKNDIAYLMGGKNAELIRAAPDLLESLFDLYTALAEDRNYKMEFRAAKALISKFINPKLL